MSPCGMICDFPPSLSMQRMQLSADPEDWTWVRWYWCQPLALPLGLWNAFGHPLYDSDQGQTYGGPQTFLEGGVYARSRISIWPGQEYHGEPEWFLHGLPLDVRVDDGGGNVCGVATWQSDVSLPAGVDTGFVTDGYMLLSGGGAGGGEMVITDECFLWYGACVHMAGGGEGGGEMALLGGDSMSLSGGGEGGGEMALLGGDSMSLSGGGEGGGDMPAAYSPYVVAKTAGTSTLGIEANTKPTGTASGDLIIVLNQGPSARNVPPQPTGFTTLLTGTDATLGVKYRVSYKTAGGSEPANYSVSIGGSGLAIWTVATVRGFSGAPVGAVASGNSTSLDGPSVTVSGSPALVLRWDLDTPDAGNTFSPPAGFTLLITTSPGDNGKLSAAVATTDGATGTLSSTYGPTAGPYQSFTLAVPGFGYATLEFP